MRYDDNLISFLLCLAVDEGWVEMEVDEVGVGGLGCGEDGVGEEIWIAGEG